MTTEQFPSKPCRAWFVARLNSGQPGSGRNGTPHKINYT